MERLRKGAEQAMRRHSVRFVLLPLSASAAPPATFRALWKKARYSTRPGVVAPWLCGQMTRPASLRRACPGDSFRLASAATAAAHKLLAGPVVWMLYMDAVLTPWELDSAEHAKVLAQDARLSILAHLDPELHRPCPSRPSCQLRQPTHDEGQGGMSWAD